MEVLDVEEAGEGEVGDWEDVGAAETDDDGVIWVGSVRTDGLLDVYGWEGVGHGDTGVLLWVLFDDLLDGLDDGLDRGAGGGHLEEEWDLLGELWGFESPSDDLAALGHRLGGDAAFGGVASLWAAQAELDEFGASGAEFADVLLPSVLTEAVFAENWAASGTGDESVWVFGLELGDVGDDLVKGSSGDVVAVGVGLVAHSGHVVIWNVDWDAVESGLEDDTGPSGVESLLAFVVSVCEWRGREDEWVREDLGLEDLGLEVGWSEVVSLQLDFVSMFSGRLLLALVLHNESGGRFTGTDGFNNGTVGLSVHNVLVLAEDGIDLFFVLFS